MSKDRFVKGFHCKCKIMYDCMPGRRARERERESQRESVMFVDCFMVLLVMKMLVELASPRSIVFHVHREMGRCLWHPKNHIKAC